MEGRGLLSLINIVHNYVLNRCKTGAKHKPLKFGKQG
jgi:hypothetical protein